MRYPHPAHVTLFFKNALNPTLPLNTPLLSESVKDPKKAMKKELVWHDTKDEIPE